MQKATDLPTVTAVVRAFNEGKHLGRLLEGLEAQTVRVDEVVLVDSGSTDDTVKVALDHGCRVVDIPQSEFSFGRSLNYGCEAAEGEVLLILSAHVYPIYDTFVEHAIKPFSDSETLISYGRQVGDDRTKFSESRIMLQWFPSESIRDQGHPFSNNANAAVRRSTWERYKYDESLTGLEDLEFAKRVVADSGRIAYVAESPVVHVHEETWEIIRNRYRREAVAYRKIMGQQSMPAYKALGLAATNIGADYWHAIRTGRLRSNFLGIPRFRFAQFQGAWEGFRMSENLSAALIRRFYYPPEFLRQHPVDSIGREIAYRSSTND